jgi:hypothetical protein
MASRLKPRHLFVLAFPLTLAATIPLTGLPDLTLIAALHQGEAHHMDQVHLLQLVQGNAGATAFRDAFEHGDELFDTQFNALDGVGANVGNGQRFTHLPRADLDGAGEWAQHQPYRVTGPNAQSCGACHNQPMNDGAGSSASNVVRDPLHTGNMGSFIQRNTTHMFGLGALQRLAEEMTAVLKLVRDNAGVQAQSTHQAVTVPLRAKGVDFGTVTAQPGAGSPVFDLSGVRGLDSDLVVKPFQWKGSVRSLREFARGASHNELGMQGVELVGSGTDADYDGVTDELSVGDITTFAVYLAAQPRPTTKVELAALGLIQPLDQQAMARITWGSNLFASIGCASCHVPTLELIDPTFSEPSASADFRDAVFPAGTDPVSLGVDPHYPVAFDLTRDQPDNRVFVNNHQVRFGALRVLNGRAQVDLYGDLKRHAMGPELAEPIADEGVAKDTFMTKNLWGVGSTGPWLHDGRATTLTEAILLHGGEGDAARAAFVQLGHAQQRAVLAFLENLVLYKVE